MVPDRRDDSAAIHAVILDYGEVLARHPSKEEFGSMARMFNVSFELFYKLWQDSRGPYDRGDIAAEEYWLNMAEQTNSSIDLEQIKTLRKIEVDIWVHHDPAMLAWLQRLCEQGIKTALLTNMPLDLIVYLQKNCKWTESLTFTTFSAEVRHIKPEPEIYEHTLRGLGASAEETLIVDDRETNIRAARALGIRGIQFRSIAQLRSELDGIGFAILPEIAG